MQARLQLSNLNVPMARGRPGVFYVEGQSFVAEDARILAKAKPIAWNVVVQPCVIRNAKTMANPRACVLIVGGRNSANRPVLELARIKPTAKTVEGGPYVVMIVPMQEGSKPAVSFVLALLCVEPIVPTQAG